MPRQRVIIGIGEALLCEYPDRIEPGGLALRFALAARRFGHVGIPVSRLGQDLTANELLTQLKAAGADLEHLQSDPDLPTGRLVERSIAGKMKRTLTPRAAFDNLQWDFDLVDLAQQAEAVVFGVLGQREGQSRSVIKQFLAECINAVRVFDLSNRVGDAIDRTQARSALETADAIIADRAALKALIPEWDGKQPGDAAAQIARLSQCAFIITLEHGDCTRTMTAHAEGKSITAPRAYSSAQHEIAITGLLHGVLNGWDMSRSVELACAAADHAAKSADEPLPQNLL